MIIFMEQQLLAHQKALPLAPSGSTQMSVENLLGS
jgi:hypothetical protein